MLTSAAAPEAASDSDEPTPRRRRRLPRPQLDRRDGFVLGALAIAALALYLGYIRHGGWYIDDWSTYGDMSWHRADGFIGLFDTCARGITGGRSVACLYHASEFGLFGGHQWLYHAWAVVMLWGMAALGYAILRRIGVPRAWGLLAMVMLILYPASDATRLWPIAAVGEYVMLLYLGGLLLALIALGRTGQSARDLHLLSLGMTLLALWTYEIAIPVVALNPLVYGAFYLHRRSTLHWRPVLIRAAIDFAAAGIMGWMRVNSTSAGGFVVERTQEQQVDRLKMLLHRAWDVWHEAYLPGMVGLVLLVGVLAGAIVAMRTGSPEQRRRIGFSLAGLAACGIVVAASAAAYLSAGDTYYPTPISPSNRVNLAGSVAGAIGFMLVVLLIVEVAKAARLAIAGRVLAVVLVAWVGLGLVRTSLHQQDIWLESARQTRAAVAKYPEAVRGVPAGAAILGFDVPQYEADWIPAFGSTWDLWGALTYATAVRPVSARPAAADLVCGATGIEQGGQVLLPYAGGPPVWGVSPNRRTARPMSDQASCQRAYDEWGPAPFFGRTVTQPQLFR